MDTLPSWVHQARAFPVAFAMVREDPLLDLEVIERIGDEARVILVASGGCTAAALAASPLVASLHLVDPNPAQIALARLKLRLLQFATPSERFSLLGHTPMLSLDHSVADRMAARLIRLTAELDALGLSHDSLGPLQLLALIGPDYGGRYEMLFGVLASELHGRAAELARLLNLSSPDEQARSVDPAAPLGQALDAVFDEVLALPNLVALFGEGATRNAVEPFSRHFARRARHALATLPAADNPYLWLMLRGALPQGSPVPWLALPSPTRFPEITSSIALMADELKEESSCFDLVHLSNILDWLSPEEAQRTLELARQALRPGGWVFIRQLNSSLDIPAAGPGFAWDVDAARAMHARDRSFFYRALHLGRKL
jgi:S-adenosylmethionine-diacylglycerol 3-amino-3-carboxypropyl transferase